MDVRERRKHTGQAIGLGWHPPEWYWTWVWYAPTGTSSADPASQIVIDDFWSLDPTDVTFSGLLATDFVEKAVTNSDNLTLVYDGRTPLTPGEFLGTITLVEPDVTPTEATGVTLGIYEGLETTNGFLSSSGTISSIPEPSTWVLATVGFGWIGFFRRSGWQTGIGKRLTRCCATLPRRR